MKKSISWYQLYKRIGKEAICKYLGLPLESTTIYEDVGYEKVYKYKEIN